MIVRWIIFAVCVASGMTARAEPLPPVVVDAIGQLFKDGLPDPRGCEYREIEIRESAKWTIKVHGWVLPGNGAQKLAIGWNGVIYPLASVGAAADLQADLAKRPIGGGARFRGNGNGWPMSDMGSLNSIGALPIQTAFLLRLGQTTAAEQVWNDGYAGEPEMLAKDPYAEMAGLWLDRWFNRATQAFLNGDDMAALAICRELSPAVARVKATAAARGIADPWPENRNSIHLWQLPRLQADLEQRVKEAPYTPVVESGQPAHGAARIAALIHDLEQSRAEQVTVPGEANIADDPTVQALMKEGLPAVEPLLHCLVEDNRLTRARYTEGMGFSGPIIPVYEAAYKALFRILNVDFPLFDDDSNDYRLKKEPRDMSLEDRMALATKISKVWDKIKVHGPAESGYLALQDDSAAPKDWFRAIDNICQPNDGTLTTYVLLPPPSYSNNISGTFTPYGERLRAKVNPSVSDLIIRRFEELVQRKPNGDFDLPQLGKMLLALADWDGKAHLADLARLSLEYDARFVHETGVHSSDINSRLVQKRLQLGDASALADFLVYIRDLPPDDLKSCYQTYQKAPDFSILWHYPDDPGAQQAAEKLFGGKDAPLVPIPDRLVASPLIGLPAFRRELLRGLADSSPAGTVTVEEGGSIQYAYNAGDFHLSTSVDSGEKDKPMPGVITFRLCDEYAHVLANIAGFPACQLYWPQAKRDAAVAACRTLIAQYGDALRGRPTDPYIDPMFTLPEGEVAKFRLAPLDHPATPEDVMAGRAIFSLPGTVRVWKMPSYPLGAAWQAEEVLVDGQWRRYYGVIEDGRAVKVAAADMEFPNLLISAAAITPHLYAVLNAPEEIDRREFNMEFARRNIIAAGAPVPVSIDIANHNGEDQEIPPGLVVTLALTHSAKVPPVISRYVDPPFDFGAFQEVPLRAGVSIATASGPAVEAGQTRTLLKGDLRDYFDLSRPGTYRLKAKFQAPGQAASETREMTFIIGPRL